MTQLDTKPRTPGNRSLVGATWFLFGLSLRRMLFSRQTLICGLLVFLPCLVVGLRSLRHSLSVQQVVQELLLPLFVVFLLPLFAICYGTACIGAEREEQTLIYLLTTRIPRWLIYLAKWGAAVVLVVAWSAGTLWVLEKLARSPGREAAAIVRPAALLGAVAYTSLFTVLGAVFRRGTIVSLTYAFFLETLLANMPGIIKRISSAFYVHCLIYERGEGEGIGPSISRQLYLPVSGDIAVTVLVSATIGLLILGAILFSRQEFRDLS